MFQKNLQQPTSKAARRRLMPPTQRRQPSGREEGRPRGPEAAGEFGPGRRRCPSVVPRSFNPGVATSVPAKFQAIFTLKIPITPNGITASHRPAAR